MSRPADALRRFVTAAPVDDGSGHGIVPRAPAVPIREIFARFWPWVRPDLRWLLLDLLLALCLPATQTVSIWLFKAMVDRVLVPRDLAAFWPLALGWLAVTAAAGLVAFCGGYVGACVGERFVLRLRTGVFRHVQSLSLDFFEGRRLGDLVSRLTGDVTSIEALVASGVTRAASYAVRVVFFAAAAFYLSWELALVAFTVVPLFWLVARHFAGQIKQASREKRRRSGAISAVAEESMGNAPLVQAYDRQGSEVRQLHREGVARLRARLDSARLSGLYGPLVDLVELLGALVVLGLGTWEMARDRLTLGGLLAFVAFLAQLYRPVRGMSRLATTVYSASASAERLVELLDARPSVVERSGALPLRRALGYVELSGVTFRYPGADRDAVRDLTCTVRPGEILALVGPSGAGKSTVTKLLLRMYDPAAGAVTLDGLDIRDLTLASLRRNIALVPQETLVLDRTVRENIAYGRPGATQEEIVAAARAADVHDFVTALPEGYDTPMGQKGRRFSGGQRQRVAIARAMVAEAPVLVLDEPTAGLDALAVRRVMRPLRRLMRGRATILVTHDLRLARDADAILVLEAGRVAGRGTHAELLVAGGAYARLHRVQERDAGVARPEPVEAAS